jgi:hypothetical protein
LCNWSPRGLAWVQEVHAKSIQDKRPVVIIHDDTDAIELPDKQDDAAFNDVYIVKGDPSSEVVQFIGIQRDDEMHLNPIGGEAGPFQKGDQLIVLCRVALTMAGNSTKFFVANSGAGNYDERLCVNMADGPCDIRGRDSQCD